jgi:hypothetical protein
VTERNNIMLSYPSQDFVLESGQLKPIQCPVPASDGGFWEDALHDYGFPLPSEGHWIAGTGGDGLMILGPATMGQSPPYHFACDLTLNGYSMCVWCRGWAELHEYLNYAAPVISLLQVGRIAQSPCAAEQQARRKRSERHPGEASDG